jgi:hypothetical protein
LSRKVGAVNYQKTNLMSLHNIYQRSRFKRLNNSRQRKVTLPKKITNPIKVESPKEVGFLLKRNLRKMLLPKISMNLIYSMMVVVTRTMMIWRVNRSSNIIYPGNSLPSINL